MQKHSTKTTKRERYITYAKSPEIAAAQERVLRATFELLHNPETPSGLFQEVSEFLTDQSNECGENLWHSNIYLAEVLKSVKPEERIGAVIAARAKEEAQEVAQ